MRPLFKNLFLSVSLLFPALNAYSSASLWNVTRMVDENLSPELFAGKSFTATTSMITAQKVLKAAETLLRSVCRLEGVDPDESDVRDFLSAYVVVNHPQEAFELENAHRVRMSRNARLMLKNLTRLQDALHATSGYGLDDLSGTEVKKRAKNFLDSFRVYRSSFDAFLKMDRDYLIQEFVDKYIEIERVLLGVKNREETYLSDFSEGYQSQLESLGGRIRHLGKDQGIEKLTEARKKLHDERREEVLYHTSIGSLYRLKALDPAYRVSHTDFGLVSQRIKAETLKALKQQVPDTDLLKDTLQGIRFKLTHFKPLKSEVVAEISGILSDENLLKIAQDPSGKVANEAIAYVAGKLKVWGVHNIWQQISGSAGKSRAESFAHVLMIINNGVEKLACEFINVTLNQSHSREITQWEKELFDRKVAGFDVSLFRTKETIDRIIENAGYYDLSWSDFSGPKGAELLLYAAVRDFLEKGPAVDWDEFPETWLADREAMQQFARDFDVSVLQAVALLGLNQLARHAGLQNGIENPDDFSGLIKILVEEGKNDKEIAQTLSYRLARVVGKQHESDWIESQAEKIENCLDRSKTLGKLVEKRLRERVLYYLQTGLDTGKKLSFAENLIWKKSLQLKTRLFVDVLQHNLAIHRDRYDRILSSIILDQEFKGMLGAEIIRHEDYPLATPEEFNGMKLVQGKLLFTAGVLNSLTILQKAVLHSGLEYGGAFWSAEEVAEKVREYSLFDYEERNSVYERLVRVMHDVFAEKGLELQMEQEIPRLKNLLRSSFENNPGARHFFSYLSDQVRASVKFGKERFSAPGLARVFRNETGEVTGAAKRLLEDYRSKATVGQQHRGLYRPLPKLKAGK